MRAAKHDRHVSQLPHGRRRRICFLSRAGHETHAHQIHVIGGNELGQLLIAQARGIAINDGYPVRRRRKLAQKKWPELRQKVAGDMIIRHIEKNMHLSSFSKNRKRRWCENNAATAMPSAMTIPPSVIDIRVARRSQEGCRESCFTPNENLSNSPSVTMTGISESGE